MAEGQDTKKKLLGWVKSALNKVEHALEDKAPQAAPPAAPAEAEAPAEAPPPAPAAPRPPGSGKLGLPEWQGSGQLPRPGSGTLPARPGSGQLPPRPGSGQLPPQPAPPRAADTGSLKAGADALQRTPGAPAPARAANTGSLKTPEEEAAESKKRLGFVMAYMKDPTGDPAFADKATVYRILSEERSYQQTQIPLLDSELKQLPPPAAAMGLTPEEAEADPTYHGLEERRAELEARLKTAQTRQTQLFMLMKKLTGVKGKTGGTGFLATDKLPPAKPPLGFKPGDE